MYKDTLRLVWQRLQHISHKHIPHKLNIHDIQWEVRLPCDTVAVVISRPDPRLDFKLKAFNAKINYTYDTLSYVYETYFRLRNVTSAPNPLTPDTYYNTNIFIFMSNCDNLPPLFICVCKNTSILYVSHTTRVGTALPRNNMEDVSWVECVILSSSFPVLLSPSRITSPLQPALQSITHLSVSIPLDPRRKTNVLLQDKQRGGGVEAGLEERGG